MKFAAFPLLCVALIGCRAPAPTVYIAADEAVVTQDGMTVHTSAVTPEELDQIVRAFAAREKLEFNFRNRVAHISIPHSTDYLADVSYAGTFGDTVLSAKVGYDRRVIEHRLAVAVCGTGMGRTSDDVEKALAEKYPGGKAPHYLEFVADTAVESVDAPALDHALFPTKLFTTKLRTGHFEYPEVAALVAAPAEGPLAVTLSPTFTDLDPAFAEALTHARAAGVPAERAVAADIAELFARITYEGKIDHEQHAPGRYTADLWHGRLLWRVITVTFANGRVSSVTLTNPKSPTSQPAESVSDAAVRSLIQQFRQQTSADDVSDESVIAALKELSAAVTDDQLPAIERFAVTEEGKPLAWALARLLIERRRLDAAVNVIVTTLSTEPENRPYKMWKW